MLFPSNCFRNLAVASGLLLTVGLPSISLRAIAQVFPDATLSSTVTSADLVNFTIDNGTRSGRNLFHSFSDFSVPTNGSAVFNNAVDITNILSRVTGGNGSSIDGLIQANGDANLFLLNPNGIVFGPNAELNIGGSFVGSTADTLLFDDGLSFSTDISTLPLLSVNVPTGVQWNREDTGAIALQGPTLSVPTGNSLTLLGGDVSLSQATTITTNQVSLGGLATAGTIQSTGAIADSSGLTFPPGVARGAVTLSDASLVDAGAGGIEVMAETLSITGGSRLQTVTDTAIASGDIGMDVTGPIEISGFAANGQFSGILTRSATDTSGPGGDINITTEDTLTLANRGFVAAVTNSQSAGGDIAVSANNLALNTGGQIVSYTDDTGNAGSITLNVAERVLIVGESEDFLSNPFLDLDTIDLNSLDFTTESNPNVVQSGPDGIPYVSVERTPEQIISGSRVLGTAEAGVDYYSFGVDAGESEVILDIDFGTGEGDETDVDTVIFLFDQATGELLAESDDSLATEGGTGSADFGNGFTGDSLISETLAEAGFYVVGVASFPAGAGARELVDSEGPQVGQTYTLQASIANQGTDGIVFAPVVVAPDVFNPNIGASSGIVNGSEGAGRVGAVAIAAPDVDIRDGASIVARPFAGSTGNGNRLDIDTQRLRLRNGAGILNFTDGSGRAGPLTIRASEEVDLRGGSFLLSGVGSEGTGNGNIVRIEAPRIQGRRGGQIFTGSLGEGDAGNVEIIASEVVDFRGLDAAVGLSGVLTSAFSNGNGGNLRIETPRLQLRAGAQIDTGPFAAGNGGRLDIIASEEVDLRGTTEFGPSAIFTSTLSTGNAGRLRIETPRLHISGGAQVGTGTFVGSTGNGGRLEIIASEIVDIQGVPGLEQPSFIFSGTAGEGNGGFLRIETPRLQLSAGGAVSADTSAVGENAGDAGDIEIIAAEVDIQGGTRSRPSGIFTSTSDTGNAGRLRVETQSLQLKDFGVLNAATDGPGNGNNIIVIASESVEISGSERGIGSGIFTTTFAVDEGNEDNAMLNSRGNAGSIEIETPWLSITDGGIVNSEAGGTEGLGGDITIRGADLVEVIGMDSRIIASTSQDNAENFNAGDIEIETQTLRVSDMGRIASFGIGENSAAGSILINAETVLVDNGGFISVAGLTQATTGLLQINADRLIVDNDGTLLSTVGSTEGFFMEPRRQQRSGSRGSRRIRGTGGNRVNNADDANGANIDLNINELLILRRGGLITANALEGRSGANIDIEVPTIATILGENSDIVADAEQGRGGNITLRTQSIIGMEITEVPNPLDNDINDINAVSLGGQELFGILDVTNPEPDPASDTVELPSALTDESDRISTGCFIAAENSFISIGRGGLPDNPATLGNAPTWDDWRPLESDTEPEHHDLEYPETEHHEQSTNQPQSSTLLSSQASPIEATKMVIQANGQVAFVASTAASIREFDPSLGHSVQMGDRASDRVKGSLIVRTSLSHC